MRANLEEGLNVFCNQSHSWMESPPKTHVVHIKTLASFRFLERTMTLKLRGRTPGRKMPNVRLQQKVRPVPASMVLKRIVAHCDGGLLAISCHGQRNLH